MNDNFEKAAGRIVLQATVPATSFTFDSGSACGGISNDSAADCSFTNKILFSAPTISDINLKSINNTDTTNTTSTGNYSYYEVPSGGWYEIRVRSLPPLSGLTLSSCSANNCSASGNLNAEMKTASITGSIPLNKYDWLTSINSGISDYDSDADAIFDSSSEYTSHGKSNRYYIEAGNAIIFIISANIYFSSATVTGTINIPADTVEFTIIKL